MTDLELLTKYNVPVPRYTSYPTVPNWKDAIDESDWKNNVRERFITSNGEISIYIHLPFCESLCTYCGCNKKITQNHSVEDDYIKVLLDEWTLYKTLLTGTPTIRELHIGGGTPTFFSPANLTKMLEGIFEGCVIPDEHEFSFEGHPNNTTEEHLRTLYNLGFRRVSFGVQDCDPEVQHVINRIQPFANVQNVTELARSIGYESVNFDLIYGLPLQTVDSMTETLKQAISVRPDRIAFYSYAHVPWTSKGQRLFDERDLPGPTEKLHLYKLGKEMFTSNGYIDIGMDHFALPDDSLNLAANKGRLFRNFMGYTTQNTGMLLGLGVSAISDTGAAFAQNSKTLHDYHADVERGSIAVKKGYFLTEEDKAFRQYILDVVCNGKVTFNPMHIATLSNICFPLLEQLQNDGLIYFSEQELTVTPPGKQFIRNIASVFDLHLQRNKTGEMKFSKAV